MAVAILPAERGEDYYNVCDDARKRRDRRTAVITEELGQIKARDVGKCINRRISGTDDIKEHLGRSLDFADMLPMRMYFAVQKAPNRGVDTMKRNRRRRVSSPLS